MNQSPVKLGLVAVVILEIGVLFFMLRVYDDFVSSPDNYYKNILVGQIEGEVEINNEINLENWRWPQKRLLFNIKIKRKNDQ